VTSPGGRADTEYLLDAAGPAAPPRDNGELTFGAPWEGQAFGLALALQESGQIDWEDFRQRLIAEISSWQAAHEGASGWSYYGCWLSALEQTVSERGWWAATTCGRARSCSRRGRRIMARLGTGTTRGNPAAAPSGAGHAG